MNLPLSAAGAPLTPDRETARRWAIEELTDPDYARARPNPIIQGLQWLFDRLNEIVAELPGNSSTAGAVIAGVLALLAVAVLAWVATMPRRRAARAATASDVFGDVRLSAEEHRARARAAAAEAQWRTAVQEGFRGLARGLEERAVLDVRAGRTADEIAREAAASFPGQAVELAAAAGAFDDVTYGGRHGSRPVYESVATTDAQVGRTRPATTPAEFATPAHAAAPAAPAPAARS
ncbi:MAG: DUF4129 domain-containing protein [Kineosporiaceae bacterium]